MLINELHVKDADTYSIGAVGEPQRPKTSPRLREGLVLRDTLRAEGLHRAIDDFERHGGYDELGNTDFLQGTLGLVLVDLRSVGKGLSSRGDVRETNLNSCAVHEKTSTFNLGA